MKLQLRESQQVALERLCEPGRTYAALWAEPRSGKTAVSLKWVEYHRPKVVVIVGPKIAEGVWRTEAAKWLATTYRFFSLTAGSAYPRTHSFKGVTLLFVNYEQFGKSPWQRLRPFLKQMSEYCQGQGMFLLDESHIIKTPNSVFGKNIRPLAADWKYRLAITGTPVTNPDQIDAIYGQWTFVNPGIRDLWPSARDFREHFGEWTTVKGYPELIRPRNQAQLNAYIQNDVITMVGPGEAVPVRRVHYRVPSNIMTGHKHILKHGVVKYKDKTFYPYKEMIDDAVEIAALNPLTRLLRLRTLVAGWIKDDEGNAFTVAEAARARLAALGKTLDKCEGKVIVAATHLHEIKLLRRYFQIKGIRFRSITGATRDRDAVIEYFQTDREVKVLLVQPRTVAMAVDISVAQDLVWYSSDFNYVTFKQASDRIKLSLASPTVWFICGRGTVDEDVWKTLQEDHHHLQKVVKKIKNSAWK